jgi:hypothetical protein
MLHVPQMNIFSSVVPYLGNKRRLLHLILEALEITGTLNLMVVRLFLPTSLQVVVWSHVWHVKMVIG